MDSAGDFRHLSRAAWPFSRLRLREVIRLSHCCVLLGLLGAFGVLALVFSAVSPEDDDIQQEFVQGNKPEQRVLANYKATREVRNSGPSTVLPARLAQPRPTIRRAVVGRVLSVDEKILGTIVGSRTGDRSPPSKAS
jgi:hypothetical protein